MNELTGRDLLRMMAQQAKNRMRGKMTMNEQKKQFNYVVNANKMVYKTIIISSEKDEKLYGKVKDMLKTSEDILNPLDKLIDNVEFELLDNAGKERYLFNLADKYRDFKEKFYREEIKNIV